MVGIFMEGLGISKVVRSGARMVPFRHFSLLAMFALKALRVKQEANILDRATPGSVTLQSVRFKSRIAVHSAVSVAFCVPS